MKANIKIQNFVSFWLHLKQTNKINLNQPTIAEDLVLMT